MVAYREAPRVAHDAALEAGATNASGWTIPAPMTIASNICLFMRSRMRRTAGLCIERAITAMTREDAP
jgi:hypothetical protein